MCVQGRMRANGFQVSWGSKWVLPVETLSISGQFKNTCSNINNSCNHVVNGTTCVTRHAPLQHKMMQNDAMWCLSVAYSKCGFRFIKAKLQPNVKHQPTRLSKIQQLVITATNCVLAFVIDTNINISIPMSTAKYDLFSNTRFSHQFLGYVIRYCQNNNYN